MIFWMHFVVVASSFYLQYIVEDENEPMMMFLYRLKLMIWRYYYLSSLKKKQQRLPFAVVDSPKFQGQLHREFRDKRSLLYPSRRNRAHDREARS